ncbi:MAG: hypothetical protein SFY69_01890 [Planctomycetota bacterium]|nr:hypothetical protein [Planctomycetota bacterium]
MPPTQPALAAALAAATIASLVGLSTGLTGCSSGAPPRTQVLGAAPGERTPEGAQVVFEVAATNPNREALHLRDVRYEVWSGGTRVFEGERSAEATLPGYATRSVFLPAGIPARTGLAPGAPLRITGEITYRPLGVIRQTLEESGWPALTSSFEGEATPAPSAPPQ